jgi:lipopolysaccharide transport system permease protein
VIPFIVQFGLFISPVGFSSDVIPEKWRLLYSINPMVGVIDGFRWAICRGASELYIPGFILSLTVVALSLWLGIWYFRKTEKSFSDVI